MFFRFLRSFVGLSCDGLFCWMIVLWILKVSEGLLFLSDSVILLSVDVICVCSLGFWLFDCLK